MTANLEYDGGEWTRLEVGGQPIDATNIIAIEVVADETTLFHPVVRITVPVDLRIADGETLVEGGATLNEVADYIAGLDPDLIDELALQGLGMSGNYAAKVLEVVADIVKGGGQ